MPVPGSSARVPFPTGTALWLRPRDPFCVVVFWQVDGQALQAYAHSQPGGSWRLRVRGGRQSDRLLIDEELPTEVDHRFVSVPDAGSRYDGEIGFRHADGSWQELTRSSHITTPVAGPTATWTAPPPSAASVLGDDSENSFPEPSPEPSRSHATEVPSTLGIPAPSPRIRRKKSPPPAATYPITASTPESPTESDTASLLTLVWERDETRTGPSSGESDHWVARVLGEASGEDRRLSPTDLPASGEAPLLPPPAPGFWFEVNAELIVYGRTERDARVTIGGRPVSLRPDGSFHFRFSLPDGAYELPVVAVNARGDDSRAARLEFSRSTEYQGAVGTHAQDPELKAPGPDALG
jgi:uncharacterized protein